MLVLSVLTTLWLIYGWFCECVHRLLTGASGGTSESQRARHKSRRRLAVEADDHSRTEFRHGTGIGSAKRKTAGGKRTAGEVSVTDADAVLKVIAGGQPEVDDCDDEDFEARKVRRQM